MSQCGEAYTYDESNVHTARWIGTTRRTRSDWEVPINQIHISINATESHKSIVQTTIGNTKLRLVTGDIAEQDTDAVVTAAHWRLTREPARTAPFTRKVDRRFMKSVAGLAAAPLATQSSPPAAISQQNQ